MKVFETIVEIFGWFEIAISLALIGVILGCVIYFNITGSLGLGLGIVVAAIGIVVGVIWATKIWRKRGTINFLSGIIATHELDDKDENL